MSTNFRTEVFKLCKALQKNETSKMIRNVIYEMSVIKEPKVGEKATNPHNDFADIARHFNTEFHGFIFLDDNLDKLNIPSVFKPNHLMQDERLLINQGYKTLSRFVELCLSEISSISKDVADSINPYYLCQEVAIPTDTISLLTDDELTPAVSAFKNGTVYKTLLNANFTNLFDKIPIESMRGLIFSLEKEINQSLGENVSKDLRDFSMKFHSSLNNITDVMFAFSILLLALKLSLKLSCHTLYRAICGLDLFVLNNDNIISIEKNISTIMSQFYKVFSQDISFDFSGSEMGSILLIDCDINQDFHIHEFGMLISQTISFAGEFGQSAKYSFVTVNEEMINIHHLVDEILKTGLPTVYPEK